MDAWAPPLDWGALAIRCANLLGVAVVILGAMWVADD